MNLPLSFYIPEVPFHLDHTEQEIISLHTEAVGPQSGGSQNLRTSSVQFSYSVMSDSLQPHGLQHSRPPCPTPTRGAHPNSCPFKNKGKSYCFDPNYWRFLISHMFVWTDENVNLFNWLKSSHVRIYYLGTDTYLTFFLWSYIKVFPFLVTSCGQSVPEYLISWASMECVCVRTHTQFFNRVWLFVILWTIAASLLCLWNSPGKNTRVPTISYSRGSFWPRDWTHTSCISCTGRQILYHWATREAPISVLGKNQKYTLLS